MVSSMILGRAMLLVATLLPVKILIILDSSVVPSYFPASLRSLDLNEPLLLLVFVFFASYAIHTLVEALKPGMIRSFRESSELDIHAAFSRLDVDSIPLNARERGGALASVASGSVFFLLCLAFPAFAFPLIFWLFILASVLILARVAYRLRTNQAQERIWREVRKSPAIGIAFLVPAGVVILCVLVSTGPNLLLTMLSSLLLRQGLAEFVKSGSIVAKVRFHATH
jgi:hypothetical protein